MFSLLVGGNKNVGSLAESWEGAKKVNVVHLHIKYKYLEYYGIGGYIPEDNIPEELCI